MVSMAGSLRRQRAYAFVVDSRFGVRTAGADPVVDLGDFEFPQAADAVGGQAAPVDQR